MTLFSVLEAMSVTLVSSAKDLLDLLHLSLTRKSLKLTQQCHARILSPGFTQQPFLATELVSAYAVYGKLIHGKIFKIGFVLDFIVANSLMSMYSKCGEFGECLKLFHEMPERNVGAWNAIISGYADSGDLNFYKDMSDFVKDMQIEGLKPDVITVSSLLSLRDGDMVKKRASCNKVDVGRRVFDSMKGGNVYTWTAMINAYVKNGSLEEGLVLFQEIQVRYEVELNKASLVSVLPACSAVSGLIGVKQIHGYAINKESNDDGKGEEAIFVYNKMLHLGNKSDMITIVGVLSACGRSGLVDEGLRIYKSTINEYRMKPTVEICACVVNMLGRSGQLG
ncbi:hypothetical protein POTOM_032086 [Populus tomentosa]|uniref:Pentatricopeptide repeat-containing protein n=1 Tax=Populus tomentosa TaxID=118781 RepID=A0A8X7Z7J9_POPTO|nr:hypothetical protein POTOM_032086 [Populus tomentosa]